MLLRKILLGALLLTLPSICFARSVRKKVPIAHYCPCRACCGPKAHGRTSTGKNAWKTKGLASRSLPFGTKVFFSKKHYMVVDDRGGPRGGFDKRGWSHNQAIIDGVKEVMVTIVYPPKKKKRRR